MASKNKPLEDPRTATLNVFSARVSGVLRELKNYKQNLFRKQSAQSVNFLEKNPKGFAIPG